MTVATTKKPVVFFAYGNSFSFYNIGGTDAVIRRLASKLLADGHRVIFLYYGCQQNSDAQPLPGLEIKYRTDFHLALLCIAEPCDIFTVYLKRADRLRYIYFRITHRHFRFHQLVFTWPEKLSKRLAAWADSVLVKLNGISFCVSPRLSKLAARLGLHAQLLLPPVPKDYFITPAQKSTSDKIRVAFLGRIDTGKGLEHALSLLTRLSHREKFDCMISGFPWLSKPETVKLHKHLLAQTAVRYVPVEYENWSPQVCASLRDMLRDIDILILPYRHLSSTIDIPLLLLEAMASLCVVITPDLGDMHEIYGQSIFCLDGNWDEDKVFELITNNVDKIALERDRLFRRASEVVFDIDGVYDKFRMQIWK
ncbi:MAG: glycosyltransferase [Sedimentisphaerales bacterium]|nr:glycosyltransferase [Sedimentisphaerales bacterium]